MLSVSVNSYRARRAGHLFLGPSGVGKTPMTIALGMAAIAQSISVYFTTVADLIEMLILFRRNWGI